VDRADFLRELAEILRQPGGSVAASFGLGEAEWDSLAIMSTVALIDEHCGATVSGTELAQCTTVAGVLALAGF
jgi:acyl carrier protein